MSTRIAVERHQSIVASPANSHNRIWPDLDPVASIEPGQQLELELRDGMDGQLSPSSSSSSLETVDLDANHPLTGPIEVRGAAPGDVLVVTPRRIVPDGFGTTAVIPGFGCSVTCSTRRFWCAGRSPTGSPAPRSFPGSRSMAGRSWVVWQSPPRTSCSSGPPRARVRSPGAAEPCWSRSRARRCRRWRPSHPRTIPPASTAAISTGTARARAAARCYRRTSGALLSIGDMHFAQGEGEVCGTEPRSPARRDRRRLAAAG